MSLNPKLARGWPERDRGFEPYHAGSGRMREVNPMTKRWRGIFGLMLLVPVLFLAGCTAGEAYRGAASAPVETRGEVPPAFRGIDPALRHWYTAPYFNPYEMP
jgi:hypothetical protein